VKGEQGHFASAKDLKLVSLIDKRDMGVAADLNIWGYGEQPFLSGNRLFLRKCHNDPWIYCIGDPKVPTQLSAIHTKPLPPVEK
jgi:hypothetical protein